MKTCEICEKKIIATCNRQKYCKECSHALRQSIITTQIRINNKSKQRRVSGKAYENSPEKIQAIKEKYKNGVTLEMIKNLVGGYEF